MLFTRSRRNYAVGLVLVLLGALGFSIKSILIKLAYASDPGIDAITLLALRMLFSLPIFIAAALWHNVRARPSTLSKKEWLIVTLLGLDGYYLASYLDFASLQYISAGLERVILFLYPTFVVLFSAAIFRRQINLAVIIALLLSYTGLTLVFLEHLSAASPNLWVGSALVLGSALAFAGFTMGSGVMVHKIGSIRFTAYTMTSAGIAMLAHFAVQGGNALTGFSVRIYGLVLLITIFSTVLPAFFMNAGIRQIGADFAAIISTTGPIATLIFAYLLLDETITALQIVGTILVLAGVYVLSRGKT